MREKTILLVEDSPDEVLLTKRALYKSNILNTIIVAHDGEEAIDYLFGKGKWEGKVNDNPEIILLDLKLPKISGLDVLKEIRMNEKTRLVPVIILTTSKEENDILESYKLGANSFICKPIDFIEFHETIKHLGMYWLLINKNPVFGEQ